MTKISTGKKIKKILSINTKIALVISMLANIALYGFFTNLAVNSLAYGANAATESKIKINKNFSTRTNRINYQNGWPVEITGTPNTWVGMISPVIEDLENDGKKELVVSVQGNGVDNYSKMIIFENDGIIRSELLLNCSLGSRRFPVIADLDYTPQMEIAVVCNDQSGTYIDIYNNRGESLKRIPVNYFIDSPDGYSSFIIDDINGDSYPEIIFSGTPINNWDKEELVVMDHKGALLEEFPTLIGDEPFTTTQMPSIATFAEEKTKYIVTVTHYELDTPLSKVRLFDNKGNIVWVKNIDGVATRPSAIADVDADGVNDIIIPTESGLYILNKEGNFILQKRIASNQYHSNVAIANLDSDKDLEIAFGYGRDVYAIKSNGEILFKYATNWFTFHPFVIADIDGNEKMDIIFNSDDDIYALNAKGELLSGFPLAMEPIAYSSPSLADIDGDSDIELISSSNWGDDLGRGKIYIWDFIGKDNLSLWPTYQHDSGHTGNYDTK